MTLACPSDLSSRPWVLTYFMCFLNNFSLDALDGDFFCPKVCASRLWYWNIRFIKYGSMNSVSHRDHPCTHLRKVKCHVRKYKTHQASTDGRNIYVMTVNVFRFLLIEINLCMNLNGFLHAVIFPRCQIILNCCVIRTDLYLLAVFIWLSCSWIQAYELFGRCGCQNTVHIIYIPVYIRAIIRFLLPLVTNYMP